MTIKLSNKYLNHPVVFVSCFTVLKVHYLPKHTGNFAGVKFCLLKSTARFLGFPYYASMLHTPAPSHLRLHTDQLRHQDPRRYPRVQVPLELQKLTHEVEIGRHHRPTAPHVFVGIRHGHEGVLHKVGDDDGCRTGHACLAVHQYSLSTLICLLCG